MTLITHQLYNITKKRTVFLQRLSREVIFITQTKRQQFVVKRMRPITLEEEYRKNPGLKPAELAKLRKWYNSKRHLPPITDEMLALFLHSCYYDFKETKIKIDTYFTVRTRYVQMFEDRNPLKVDNVNGEQVMRYFMLPSLTPDGSRVIFVKLGQKNPSFFNFTQAVKSFIMTADLDHYYTGTTDGFIIVFDWEDIIYTHVSVTSMRTIMKSMYYLQKAMPVRLTGIHYLNGPYFLRHSTHLVSPFLKEELASKIHIHKSDFTEFFKFVPQKMMPKDYGGEAPSVEELHEEAIQMRRNHKQWFEDEEKLRVNESRRRGIRAKKLTYGAEGIYKLLLIEK